MDSGATFSPCKLYRYRLWRYWDRTKGPATFILLNPSTADETKNDPTVERCQRRAKSMGYGGLEVVNIFAFRSTNPAHLYRATDPVGPDNNQAIVDAAALSKLVICGWGRHGDYLARGADVRLLLRRFGVEAYCLGRIQNGEPKHPLYIPYAVHPKRLLL